MRKTKTRPGRKKALSGAKTPFIQGGNLLHLDLWVRDVETDSTGDEEVKWRQQQNVGEIHRSNHPARSQGYNYNFQPGEPHQSSTSKMAWAYSAGWTGSPNLQSGGRTTQVKSTGEHPYGCSTSQFPQGTGNSGYGSRNLESSSSSHSMNYNTKENFFRLFH